MLGDLYAEKSQITGNSRLRFYASFKNKELIYHLYSIFKSYVKTEPKVVNRNFDELTNSNRKDIRFSTLKYSLFNWCAAATPMRVEDFYIKINGKNIKIVPKNSYDKLTAVSLAFWVMDDGSYNKSKGHVILCTDSYSKEDVNYLMNILNNKFELSCGLINYRLSKAGIQTYRIRINKSSIPNLINLIKPHMIPSMYYKLGI